MAKKNDTLVLGIAAIAAAGLVYYLTRPKVTSPLPGAAQSNLLSQQNMVPALHSLNSDSVSSVISSMANTTAAPPPSVSAGPAPTQGMSLDITAPGMQDSSSIDPENESLV